MNSKQAREQQEEPSIDDVLAMYRAGEFRKVRIIAIRAEGGIREFEFNVSQMTTPESCR